MNRKVLILALPLLMLALVVPVMADPTNGKKVPVTHIPGGVVSAVPGTFWKTDGNITQRRDYTEVRSIALIIDGEAPLQGFAYGHYDRMMQWDRVTGLAAGSMVIDHLDVVFDYPTAGGGFEGNIIFKVTDSLLPTSNLKGHMLLQGYGAFEGQTLQLSYDGPFTLTPVWTGYLSKP